jgi:methylated-DNA-[protein]-cysteine S-methyltransferase
LPGPEPKKIESRLLKNLPGAQFDSTYFKTLQKQIAAYFEGSCVNFNSDIPVVLDGFGIFSRKVLIACRSIKFGQRITYSGLAKKAGRPAASRAVGNALAKNPLPLIIPCHRVLRTDGKMGGFSAPGGISFKKRMLTLEHKALKA